jgi:hypothetical protein
MDGAEEGGDVSTKVKATNGQETQAEKPCGVGGLWPGAAIVITDQLLKRLMEVREFRFDVEQVQNGALAACRYSSLLWGFAARIARIVRGWAAARLPLSVKPGPPVPWSRSWDAGE